ncbi:hypothetical protein BKI52_22250 [marine bacterium AO1-C]|nr:hypothetical protein BKI52_22250 [marine bacterium AO1-C]
MMVILWVSIHALAQTKSTLSDPSQTVQIVALIKKKDVQKLQKILNAKNVNLRDKNGVTLLNQAIKTEAVEVVKLFLKKGANPNLANKDYYNTTSLMAATGHKTTIIAQLLIKYGADVDIQDKNGDPVIHWTAYNGNVPYTRLLLEHKANLHLKSKHANGAMEVALKEWHTPVSDLLLAYGHSIHQVAPQHKPLIKAVKNNDLVTLESMLTKENANTKDGAGSPLLIVAAEKGYLEMVKLLLAQKARINAMNAVGHTALNRAVFFGQAAVVKYLLQKGANVNQTDQRFALTPLMAAARKNRLELAKLLLEKGANINDKNTIDHFTPIVWAALYQYHDFVKLLLRYNPDLSIQSKYEQRDIFRLVRNPAILSILKKHKAKH